MVSVSDFPSFVVNGTVVYLEVANALKYKMFQEYGHNLYYQWWKVYIHCKIKWSELQCFAGDSTPAIHSNVIHL